MDGWQIGLIAVVVIGLAVIVFGAVRDRLANERRQREILAPPSRDIPGFSPDSPAPRYLSELQARRPPADAPSTDLGTDERARLEEWTRSAGATAIRAGYATVDLVTDRPTGWAVLTDATVLLSNEDLVSVRELLPALERQLPSGRPLVVAAPHLSRELIDMCAVNHIQRVITILPVQVPETDDQQLIATTTGARPISRTDLQAGYLPTGTLGHCATWLSTPTQSYLR